MKRFLIAIVVLCCSFYAIAAGPSSSLMPDMKTPAIEIAELETLIAKAKASGQTPDPAWTVRIQELIPLVKGHASKVPSDLTAFQVDGGFTPGAVIRPQQLTQLERQISDIEFQIRGGLSNTAPDEVTFSNLKAELNVLYSQRTENRHRNPLDQGNDVCPGTGITGIPFTDTGSTAGLVDNYAPSCGFAAGAPDVVYEFTPSATLTYNISLEGSNYDTELYIRTTDACPGTSEVACNDDWFGLQSFLSVTLNAGQTYFIIVDGYFDNSGDYILNITDNCNLDCQSGDQIECAEVYGVFDGADCNGGCNNNPTPTWQTINPFQTVCGRNFAVGGTRDTDWYRLTLTEACSLSITLNSEVSTQIVVIDNASCPYGNIPFNISWAYPCSTVTFLTQCLQPGEYTVFFASSAFDGILALRDYRARVDLVPCGDCQVDAFLQAPGSAGWHTCGAGNDNNLRPSEDYTFAVNIPYDGEWTFSTCNDDSIWDSYIYLTGTCNGNVYMQDDDGCGGIGLSVISCVNLVAGNYYLTVEGWSSIGCGPFVLNVFECLGSCCYGDPANPSCAYVGPNDCDSLGGLWTNLEPCSTGACFTRPDCGDGEIIFSQVPSLPDEPWNANQSDLNASYLQYENYSVASAIGSIRFWGVFLETGSCNTDPQSFEITFIDSVNNLTQTYNVTLTANVLPLVYFGTFNLLEYTAELNPPCTITNGWVRVAESASAACTFHWSWTILGNGQPAHESLNNGPPVQTSWELAFCLDQAPCVIDSLTYLWDAPGNAILRWYQNLPGVVTIWYTIDPNAVYPAGYTPTSFYYPAGNNALGTNANFADHIRVVLTLDCTIAPPATAIAPPPFLIIENNTGE